MPPLSRLRKLFRRRMSLGEHAGAKASGGDSPAVQMEKFDVGLPSKHSYLGDLREVCNTPYYAEGDLILLPVVFVPNVVLMPNQEMPLTVGADELDLNPLLNDLMDVEHQRKGFVCMAIDVDVIQRMKEVREKYPEYFFGTIATVVRIENDATDAGLHPEAGGTRMIVRGCQRGLLKQSVVETHDFHQRHYGWFRIVPEVRITSPIWQLIPSEWRIPLMALGCPDLKMVRCAAMSPWLFGSLDVQSLIKELKTEIIGWQLSGEYSGDPTDFSYWLASNLPLPAQLRLQLLGSASTLHRLRTCLLMLRTAIRLDCALCNVVLASCKDGISMTRGGLTGTYINPTGLTQEIMTFTKISNARVFGTRTTEFTWFPGYAWRHLQCRGCHTHLGWRYDAESSNLEPSHFYGLRRVDVMPSIEPDESWGQTEDEITDVLEQKRSSMSSVIYRENM